MQYIIMIYENQDAAQNIPAEEQAKIMDAHYAYGAAMREAGVYVGGDALHSAKTATTVRQKDGKRLTMDGPYAETKEQLGGYYVVNVANLDEAIEWAYKMPGIPYGDVVEVRPLVDFSQEQPFAEPVQQRSQG